MKILFTLLVFATIEAIAADGQPITLTRKNAPLKEIFKAIQKQSEYSFLYGDDVLIGTKPVTIEVKEAAIQQVLDICFKEQPLRYELDGNLIYVRKAVVQALSQASAPSINLVSVKGRVIDEESKAIPKATISVKGTKIVAFSDNNGEFALDAVDNRSSLLISCIGFQSIEMPLKYATTVTARLKVAVNSLDENIVLGYRNGTRRTNVGAVSIVSGQDIASLPVVSVDKALQGQVAGLHITTGNGSPGGAVSNITLRGIATGGIGIARNPIFVVDGTPVQQAEFHLLNGSTFTNNPPATNPLAQINMDDVESISVLKDAAAISIYGSQASNGVILITTKKGRLGKMRVNISHQADLSAPLDDNREVLNQQQYLDLLKEAYKNADPLATDQSIFNDLKGKFPYQANNGDTSFYPAPNWFDELYSNSALGLTTNLSVSGGSDKAIYYLGLGNVHQKGALKGTTFQRSSLRYNMDLKPTTWLKLGMNSSVVYTHQDLGELGDEITNPNGFSYQVSPLLPIRQTNGDFYYRYPTGAGGSTIVNPVAAMQYNSRTVDGYRFIGNAYGEIRFLRNFTFRSNIGMDFLSSSSKLVRDKRVGGNASFTGGVSDIRNNRSMMIVNNMLSFGKSLGNGHSIAVMATQEAQIGKNNQLFGSASGYAPGFSNNEISSGSTTSASGDQSKTTSVSYVGAINYDFQRKYLASFSYRLDGSSRFGSKEPYNSFWSFGAGWIPTEETFLQSATNWFSYLKLRGSVGVAGNSTAIPSITRSNRVRGVNYTGTALLESTVLLTTGNPYVKPESTFNLDLGLEMRLFKDRISFTADYYRRKTYDMVTDLIEPLVSGRTTVYGNLGDVVNRGLELSLQARVISTAGFSWNISGNWATNSNKLVKAANPESYSNKFVYKVGENFESWYLVRWAGVDPADGSPQWLDMDGKATKTWNSSADRLLVGKPQPDGFGGITNTFTYRNIELSAFLYYAYGYQIYNTYLNNMINDGRSQPYSNQSTLALDRWQKPGDVALNPKRVLNNPERGVNVSTRYLTDADHIRLKNLSIAYNLGDGLKNKLRLSRARIFVQANNLGLLWSKAKDMDPDNSGTLGEVGAGYPQQRTYSAGFNIEF